MVALTSKPLHSPGATTPARPLTLAVTTSAEGPALRHHLTAPAAKGGEPATYAVDLTPEDDGGFLVTCPEFPEIWVFSEDEKEALELARRAIEATLGARRIRLAAIS